MAAVNLTISGGDKLQRHLAQIAQRLGRNTAVRVGFLERARYPAAKNKAGLHVAQVAFWNEFGTIKAPPRPFFRYTIATKSPGWGKDLGSIAVATNYNGPQTLALMGERIKDQIQTSINSWSSPPNAASTIRRKGFDAPLRHTMLMLRSVDYEVVNQ